MMNQMSRYFARIMVELRTSSQMCKAGTGPGLPNTPVAVFWVKDGT